MKKIQPKIYKSDLIERKSKKRLFYRIRKIAIYVNITSEKKNFGLRNAQ